MTVTETSSTVFDLNAVLREKTGEPFRFLFGPHEFEMPAKLDFRVIDELNDGQLGKGFRRLFTVEQWALLDTVEEVLDLDGMLSLMKAYFAHLGMTLGESQASTTSSAPTAGP